MLSQYLLSSFHILYLLCTRELTQNMMARVTALWHVKKKPPIPMSTQEEA